MPFHIKVSDPTHTIHWELDLNAQNYEQFETAVKSGKDSVRITDALIYPVRTNSLKSFSKDFFLPITANYYGKIAEIQNVALKVLATLASVFIDLITLPIRAFTCIFRINSNYYQNEAPLKSLLATYMPHMANPIDKKLLDSDFVDVEMTWETQTGDFHHDHILSGSVNFIELPKFESKPLINNTYSYN